VETLIFMVAPVKDGLRHAQAPCLVHGDERGSCVAGMGVFRSLDKPERGKRLVVLDQFDSGIELHDRLARCSGETFHGLHQTAANALPLAGRPDGKLAHVDTSRLDLGKGTAHEVSVLRGQEKRLFPGLLFQ
jgi:hypothetical protein